MGDYWDFAPTSLISPPVWDVLPDVFRDRVLFLWLEYAIDKCDFSLAVEIFAKRPDWINTFTNPIDDDSSYCPLVAGTIAECPTIVEWLLSHGADPIVDNLPLWKIAMKLRQVQVSVGYYNVLKIGKLLLDSGASPDQICPQYETSPQIVFHAVAGQNLAEFILLHHNV